MKTSLAEGRSPMVRFLGAFLLLVLAGVAGANRAVAGSIIYSDEFNGSALSPSWQVQPGQGAISLDGGNLRYYNQGFGSSPGGWHSTSLALALSFSGTSWEIDTKAVYHLNYLDGSGASSGAQRPQVMVSFDPVSTYNNYADFDRGVDAWYSDNHLSAWYIGPQGQTTADGLLNPADAGTSNNVAGGEYWLQIIRKQDTLTMNYSYDGSRYTTAFSTPLSDPSSSYNELLLSATTWATVGSFTDYDYVTIESLDSSAAPEPGTFVLGLSFCLVGLGLRRFRSAPKRLASLAPGNEDAEMRGGVSRRMR